ncbi:putative chemoreceptor glutamine deamidase CheD 3 [Gammaproteobacteria bacterium]
MMAMPDLEVTPGVFIHPGEFHFGQAPLLIGTLLGSCVAVTLWHPKRKIGGMCHIMLPTRGGWLGKTLDGRYADEAVELLHQSTLMWGARATEFQAKLFGGGNMFKGLGETAHNVSHRNVETTRKLVQQRGYQLSGEHVRGSGHRKLIFDLETGDVWLRFKKDLTDRETVK